MLRNDFKEFIQSLNDHDVRYLLVGGLAMALHGYERFTKDMDIWVSPQADNAVRIVRALDAFGFGSLRFSPQDFAEDNRIIELGYPPARIDIWTSLAGVTFDDCYPQSVVIEVDGVRVSVIDLESLKLNKHVMGRDKDLSDIRHLQKIRRAVMHDWPAEIPVGMVICDALGVIESMNDRAAIIFGQSGGWDLIGRNLIDCHPPEAQKKIERLFESRKPNAYTVSAKGSKVMLYQAPRHANGEFCGYVEFILTLPEDIPELDTIHWVIKA